MKKKLIYVIAAMLSMAGCITNDLPYPVVVPNVVSVTATDAEDVLIDYENRTVTLYFPERVDLRKVNITSVSIDKAKQHCEQYVEVTYDAAGNKVIYDDWRLPTAREIDIILDHQYDSQAMVEVLSGRRYYCAFNPDGSGTTQYLRENTSSTGGSNHVRCIRDAY